MNSIRLTKTAIERLGTLSTQGDPDVSDKHIAAGIAEVSTDSEFLSRILSEPTTRSDGSITVDLTPEETATLHGFAKRWETSAREAFESGATTSPSDIRSSDALVSQIEKYL